MLYIFKIHDEKSKSLGETSSFLNLLDSDIFNLTFLHWLIVK